LRDAEGIEYRTVRGSFFQVTWTGVPGSWCAPIVRTSQSIESFDSRMQACEGAAERVQEARPSPAMDPDRPIPTFEVLQHVAVRRQFEDPAAEEVVRMPRYRPGNCE